jgi:hypothetical protein
MRVENERQTKNSRETLQLQITQQKAAFCTITNTNHRTFDS